MTVDFPDWTAPQANANAISTTGAPPLVMKQLVDVLIGQSIALSSSITRPASGQFTINQPGYEIELNVGSLTNPAPLVSVELQWYDSTFGALTEAETYEFYSGNANGHQVHGRGPSKGDRVVVVITNHSSVGGITVSYTLLQTSRTFTREFWHTIAKAGVQPGYLGLTAANSDVAANVLAADSHLLAALTGLGIVLPLYTGTVRLFGVTTDTTPANSQWILRPAASFILPAANLIQAVAGVTGFAPFGSSSVYLPDVPLPRVQCVLTLQNTNATTAETLTANITAQEDRA